MRNSLPGHAVEKLLRPLSKELNDLQRPAPPSVIPVSRSGWLAALDDAAPESHIADVQQELRELVEEGLPAGWGLANGTAGRLVIALRTLCEGLWFLEAFLPSKGLAAALHAKLVELGNAALNCSAGLGSIEDVGRCWADVEFARNEIVALADDYEFPQDPCEVAFGVAYDKLCDATGTFSPTRLLSHFYGQYAELERRLSRMLEPITPSPPDLLTALNIVEAFILTDRPAVALRTAVRIHDLFLAELDKDPEALSAPLREMKLSVDRSAASHAGIVRTVGQLDSAETAADRAYLALDLYRRFVEGQLKPWARALLTIRGRSAPSTLSALRDQLLADGSPLLHDAAAAILPTSRNASAHEDYVWDEEQQLLHVGDSVVRPDDLEEATGRAYAFMAGAECGWACARSSSPQFARLLDADDPPGGFTALNARSAVAHFGSNGLKVNRWTLDHGTFTVTLDELPYRSINPCFQAVMWASRRLETTQRFIVTLPNRSKPVLDLSRPPLDATFLVWRQALTSFAAMPVCTFLPANTWARLAMELPERAVKAAAWLAINDAVHAYMDAKEVPGPLPGRVAHLVAHLRLIATAAAATAATLPEQATAPLLSVMELADSAASWNVSAAHGLGTSEAASFEREIHVIYESLPVPAVLPTLDARPLDQIEW